jgi:hypothetical protein
MKRMMLIFGLAVFITPPVLAQVADERAVVMAAVDRVFSAINSNDAEAFKQMMVPEGTNISLRYQPDGRPKIRVKTNLQEIAEAGAEKRKFTEKYWNPTLLIHNGIAMFWAPYSFDIDGKRSHCGVDQFDFVKVDGQWKLASSTWTVEPDGCPKEVKPE